MSTIFTEYLKAKYASGGPDDSRFKDVDGEIHTSEVGRCQRRLWWERRNPQADESSPYFELGRVLEDVYGAALGWRHGDLDESDLNDNKPWGIAPMVPEVEQDINIEVFITDDVKIPGEADWAVYRDDWMDEVREHGGVDEVALATGDVGDGERRVTWQDGETTDLAPGEPTPVGTVIETKTIRELALLKGSPKDSHLHQLWGYMWALNAPGRWDYMVRNDLSMASFEQPLDEDLFVDVELRVRRHRENMRSDEYPRADPANKWSCYYCPHKNDCDGALM